MPIKEPLLFISIEDFKNWKGFDKLLFENVTNTDENIWFAISIASSNIDYLSGFAISKKWPEQTITIFTDNIQTATAHYVRFLCTKGVDYTRGQASMAQGGIVYSESNPNDPYYIPPEVFNYLRNINEYTTFQGFNLDVKPKTSFFSKFLSNKGEINPLENYLQITNTIAGKGILIEKTHPVNIMGTVVTWSVDDKIVQNKLIAGTNITIIDNVISASGGSGSSITVDPNSFALTNNNLTLSDDLVSKRFNEVIEYPILTVNKTIIGSINEIINNKQERIVGDASTITSGADGYINEKNQIRIYDAPKEPVALRLIKFNVYPDLNTTDKTIIGAINELLNKFNDYYLKTEIDTFLSNIINNVVTPLQNDIIDLQSSVGWLNFNNFNISFLTVLIGNNMSKICLMGKITIGNEVQVNNNVWSFSSVFTSNIDPVYKDLGTTFTFYKINAELVDTPIIVTGTWTNPDIKISTYNGIEILENDENKYEIIFFNDNGQKVSLMLDVSSLVPPSKLTPSISPIMPQIESKEYTFDPKSFKVENNTIELQDELIKERFKIDKWKEVGTLSSDNNQISYEFVVGKKYRVYYRYEEIKMEIYKELVFFVKTPITHSFEIDYWISQSNNRYDMLLYESALFIRSGDFLKLEELQ